MVHRVKRKSSSKIINKYRNIPIVLFPSMGRSNLTSVALRAIIVLVVAEIAGLCLCAANSSFHSPACVERERQALLEFKASLHDPSNSLSSWQGVHCCQWEGIGCDIATGHVVKLDLSNPFMTCKGSRTFKEAEVECGKLLVYNSLYQLEAANVNPSLLHLEYLTYLDLSGNYFYSSPIPMFIGSMQRLRHLSLSLTGFGGRVPSSLGNLTNLCFLDLSLNFLEARDINWISGLRALEHLDMSGVHIGKPHNLFQVLYRLPSLLHIQLDDCGLNRLLVPRANLTNALKLQVLSLAANGLTLSALGSLQNMTSLVHLDLSRNNNLTIVPSWFGNFRKLEYLDLSFCGLHGPIPNAIQNMTFIKFLDFSRNNFTSVPSWFAELKTLLYLDLSENELSSMEISVSSILRNLCHLKVLDFSFNKLPEELFGHYELSTCIRYDLESMDLSYNRFSDRLPSWLGQFENLKYLTLGGNLFSGLIPHFFYKKFPKLEALDLSSNKLEGPIPSIIGQLIGLFDLDLSKNYFNGTIPQSISQLVNLYRLQLSDNSFSGTIPQNLSKLVNLQVLGLSKNKLYGSIPIYFGQLLNLSELDLSSNYLNETIPIGKEWPSIIPSLEFLDLSNNQISGSLPKHIGHIPFLQYLFLGSNLINGSIPNSLCRTWLQKLDLSKNRFVGEIPNCWQDNEYWEDINLSSNRLSGVFPSSLGNLSSLLWLHLNENNLQGELPVSMRKMKNLLILDVGENQLFGRIPSWIATAFPSLQILRLRRNMLSGGIPSQLCQMSSLKILDLSRNNLQGSIPWCIGNLQGMTLSKASRKSIGDFNLSFRGLMYDSLDPWSNEHVKEIMKGREYEYVKILELLVTMDLSENHLVGFIPEQITLLNGLQGLNLSNNHLIGEIPKTIGDMKSLESFDVSNNQLSGRIPSSIPALTFLSHLNLSRNNFSGPIPTDNQFYTYDPSIYAGNPYLCGLPLPNKCPGDDSDRVPSSEGFEDRDDKIDKLEKSGFYFVVAAGFSIGFWGVIGVLFFKKSWRHACFRRVEDVADTIYVEIAIKVAKLKKWLARNRELAN